MISSETRNNPDNPDIPDILGLKLSDAVSLLKTAGLPYVENVLSPAGRFARSEGMPRVVRYRRGGDGAVLLDICNVAELVEENFDQKQQS